MYHASFIEPAPSVPDDPPHLACVLFDRLLEQARRTPSAIAVICGDQQLTYAELVRRARTIARSLQHSSPDQASHVGLAIGRSIDLPAALWGIVASGAAYIPLDPDYPQARLDQMIDSARLTRIITTREHSRLFPGREIILIEDIRLDCGTESLPETSADDPLYAIFTSGSTGQPKAAAVLRRGFTNLLDWYSSEFSISSGDRFLVITSPSFDLTQKNLFAPLLAGATIVIDHGSSYDIRRILDLVTTWGITVVNCTPSAFQPLVDIAAATDYTPLATLRLVVLGGEPIPLSRLRSWLTHTRCRAEIANTYGPTECTDICSFHRLDRQAIDRHPFVPLSRTVPNTQVAILDESMRPVPDGETGELWIGGAGVGTGYLHDPQRTAQRFFPNPHPALFEGRTIYRTGDLFRRSQDGTLEFRGRVDHQVKINGHRMELGEIEARLEDHPTIQTAIAVVRKVADGSARLHACLVPAEGHAPLPETELRAFLADRLPAAMIPSRFRFVASLPLTPNGKIDRLALAASEDDATASSPAITTTQAERKLLELWSGILGQAVSDPDRNFFDLGATSVHLAMLHARLKDSFGREAAITDLFAHSNVRSLAAFLSPAGQHQTASSPAKDRARLQQQALARFRNSPR